MSLTGDDTLGTNRPDELSLLVIQLFKGPLYRDSHEKLWEPLTRHRRRVADHVAVLGLRLEVDETDGYAFLRSLRDGESDIEYPRLVARHSLSFTTSLLIALLRKRLLEFDTSSSEVRLILSRDQILDLARGRTHHHHRIDDSGGADELFGACLLGFRLVFRRRRADERARGPRRGDRRRRDPGLRSRLVSYPAIQTSPQATRPRATGRRGVRHAISR